MPKTADPITSEQVRHNPKLAAEVAGLRYSDDQSAGYSRKGAGKGFAFYDTKGVLITDAKVKRGIKALVIPPAWKHVWINPNGNGHILCTGYDAAGRKQYIYHERWHQLRNEANFGRLEAFGKQLPMLREKLDADMRRHGLARRRIVATAVHLLETTLIRIGNSRYANENESYGLTTLLDKHVEVRTETIEFEFRGKSGKEHDILIRDPRTARILQRCHELPGQRLFQFIGDDGVPQPIDSGDVNEYIRDEMGLDFSAKDFRTWGGSTSAVKAFGTMAEDSAELTEANRDKAVTLAMKAAAKSLGNTPSVTRQHYVHPAVVGAFQKGTLRTLWENVSNSEAQKLEWLSLEERVLAEILNKDEGFMSRL